MLLAYYRDHYFRAFLKLKNGARRADESINQLGYLWQMDNGEFLYERSYLPEKPDASGPLWLGPLKDEDFVKELLNTAKKNGESVSSTKTLPFLELLVEELDVPFHYDTHALARRNGLEVKRVSEVIERLCALGFRATRTHFSPTSIKTDAPFLKVLKILSQ